MKTLRRLVAVAMLLGSCQLGIAQSTSTPTFKSDTEKQAWIEANPEAYAEIKGKVKQFTAEEKKEFMAEHPSSVFKPGVKVGSETKVSAKFTSVEQNDPALKDAAAGKEAAAIKEAEAKKVKSTTLKQ